VTYVARTLGAVALCAIAGCGTLETSDDRVNPDKPLWYSRPVGALHVLFMRELTASSRTVGEAYERGRGEIDPYHGRVFLGTSDHGLYCLRSNNGAAMWRFETLAPVQSEPLYDVDLDVVYFGSNDGALYAVHAFDGKLVWRFESGAEVGRKAVLVGEMLYFANGADNLFAVDRRSGKAIWHVHRTPALGMEVSGYGGPAYDGGVVFFPYSDGHVGAYDARDGSERWTPVDLSAEAEQSQGGQTVRYLDVDTTPVPGDLGPAGKVVFVASYAGGVYALDQERGAPAWKNERAIGVSDLVLWTEPAHMPRPGSPEFVAGGPPVPAREVLLASSGPTGLWALDPTTGKELWRLPLPEGGITAPVPIAGALLIGTTRYGAFLLSPRNGRPIDGFDLGSGFSQTPAAFGNRAYMLSNAGTLVALQVELPVASPPGR
jgi:outer membrane protein assembly factor BamB